VRQATYEFLVPLYGQCFCNTGASAGDWEYNMGYVQGSPRPSRDAQSTTQQKRDELETATTKMLCSFPVAVVAKLLITAFKVGV
jgi:hypothetical protein